MYGAPGGRHAQSDAANNRPQVRHHGYLGGEADHGQNDSGDEEYLAAVDEHDVVRSERALEFVGRKQSTAWRVGIRTISSFSESCGKHLALSS